MYFASGGVYSPLDWPEEDWNATFATNLTGLWLVTKYVCKQMVNAKLKGTVINISSISGLNRGKLPGAIAYAVSKEGVNAITKVLLLTLARMGSSHPSFQLNMDFLKLL